MSPDPVERPTPSLPWRGAFRAWAVGFVLFSVWALWAGEDTNWDLQNYHEYGPYALLQGCLALDVGPAGIQGYFNPLPYLPLHLLRQALPPPAVAVAQAAMQALTVAAAWLLAGALGARDLAVRSAAVLAGTAGAMAISEIGTSFADLALSAPLLLGLLVLIRAWQGNPRLFLPAGLLVGAAVGLKLTNAIFIPALAAAALLPWRGAGAGATLAAAWRIAAGGTAGILLTGGAWAAYLWATLGNPVFPAMNGVFRSPSANPDSFADLRFVPQGLGQALLYPWWIATGAHPTAEFPSDDPRLLLALPLSLLVLAAALLARRRPAPVEEARLRAMLFLLVGTAAWLLGFAIHRYAIVPDLLAGMLLVILPAAWVPGRMRRLVALSVAVLLLAATRAPDWGHRPWAEARPLTPPPSLRSPAAVLVTAYPMGIWAPALPPESRLLAMTDTGLATGGPLRARIQAGLRAPPGGRLLTLGPDLPMEESTRATMADYGVVPTGPCERTSGAAGTPVIVCGATLAPGRRLAAPDLTVGTAVDFTAAGAGWTYLVARPLPATPGWTPAGPEGTRAEDGVRMVLRAEGSAPRLLAFDFSASGGAPARIGVSVDGRPAADWVLPSSGDAVRELCLPAAEGDGVRHLTFQGGAFVLRRMALRAAGPAGCAS
ncbi:glycosyltransferase 87 family protein [Roseomonas populi]|uniref:Glycosyltransferase 87 family protein n=1 Tax=Roseomonas populi TaxID=3121582 RepID=A0ABT1X703_9PROT|nr:glycosyltransferase 87 family protein [Roseomonas pecuniae]MCR0983484.1 glycosyltransferase 87 family protein [Roseomonas pecuniae]